MIVILGGNIWYHIHNHTLITFRSLQWVIIGVLTMVELVVESVVVGRSRTLR
jgi:hypothetical protein